MTDLAGRWAKARAALHNAALDGMLLTTEPSIFYLSGTVGSRPPGLIVSADPETEPILVCRGGERDSVAALTSLQVLGTDARNPAATLREAFGTMGLTRGTIGFEDTAITYAEAVNLKMALPETDLRPATQLINRLRLVKDEEEIAHMRKAGEVSDLAMMAAIEALKAGKSETLAAAAAESTMREHGMFIAYETLIGSGFRSGLLRRYPNFTVPDPDDIIKIDLAAKLSFASGYGYHTDQTRSITIGKPSPEKQALLEAIRDVQEATVAALKPGKTVREVSLEGLAVVKGTSFEELTSMSGHGLGLDIHEWPSFNTTSEVVLEPGQCYAIEPHIIVPGRHTACLEDTLVITENGHERITHLPYELWG